MHPVLYTGRLVGKDIPHFTVDSSPLSDLLTTDGAARITQRLIAMKIIPSDASYKTFTQIGGLWSPHRVFAAAGYGPEAARAKCAPIAALLLKADRDAAIAEFDEGLHAAAHSLVGSMRSPHTVFAAAGYNREAANALLAPIAALTLKTDRDAAIAELDEGLHAAAHSLVGNMRGNVLGGGHPNQEIHFLMVRALACLGLVLGLGWAHPNPNPNAHPNPNPNPNQVEGKLMHYSCTHTAAAWKLATLLNAPTCDAAG
jgi:hypothetical protein